MCLYVAYKGMGLSCQELAGAAQGLDQRQEAREPGWQAGSVVEVLEPVLEKWQSVANLTDHVENEPEIKAGHRHCSRHVPEQRRCSAHWPCPALISSLGPRAKITQGGSGVSSFCSVRRWVCLPLAVFIRKVLRCEDGKKCFFRSGRPADLRTRHGFGSPCSCKCGTAPADHFAAPLERVFETFKYSKRQSLHR